MPRTFNIQSVILGSLIKNDSVAIMKKTMYLKITLTRMLKHLLPMRRNNDRDRRRKYSTVS